MIRGAAVNALRRAAIATASALLLFCLGCGRQTPVPGRIILLSMDTVRADHVTGWGDARTTPNLAAIAAEGARFPRFYAASSYTIPSHMSIFTGLDPREHGMLREGVRLAPEVPTLASLLAGAGFVTQAFQEGGYVAARFGFDRGFQSYVEFPRLGLVTSGLPQVLDWIRARDDEPYFLFLHSYAAHFPYGGYARYRAEHPERGLPPREEITRFRHAANVPWPEPLCALINQFAERHEEMLDCDFSLPKDFPSTEHFEEDRDELLQSYDARIAQLDAVIGAIEQVLREQGRWDDTLLIVTADHGEAFFENQGESHHGYIPFESILHVPLVISFPRLLRDRGTRVVGGLAWHLDLLPTILALAGVEPPAGLGGRDLVPELLGNASLPDDRAVFPLVASTANRTQYPLARVTLQGPLKWITGQEQFGDAEGLLFDLGQDPGEGHNLRAQKHDEAQRLAELGRAWESGLHDHEPVPQQGSGGVGPNRARTIELPPTEREKLRALGYGE